MPKRVDHDLRRRQILDALCDLVAREGLAAASFRDIAREAGVSVSLVQYYFGSKTDLLTAANAHVARRSAERMTKRVAALGPDASPLERLQALSASFLPDDRESRQAMILFYAFYAAHLTEHTTETLARGEQIPNRLVELIAEALRDARAQGEVSDDIDIEAEATLIAAALPGLSSAVIAGFSSMSAATAAVTHAINRLRPP